MTEQQRIRLTELVAEMRRVAAPVGSMHAYWDDIFDAEAVLSGRQPSLIMTEEDRIVDMENCLRRRNG